MLKQWLTTHFRRCCKDKVLQSQWLNHLMNSTFLLINMNELYKAKWVEVTLWQVRHILCSSRRRWFRLGITRQALTVVRNMTFSFFAKLQGLLSNGGWDSSRNSLDFRKRLYESFSMRVKILLWASSKQDASHLSRFFLVSSLWPNPNSPKK